MSEYESKKKLHFEIMAIWKRFQDLQQRLLVLQGDIDKLDKDNVEIGKKIYEAYKASSAGLDGEETVNSIERNRR